MLPGQGSNSSISNQKWKGKLLYFNRYDMGRIWSFITIYPVLYRWVNSQISLKQMNIIIDIIKVGYCEKQHYYRPEKYLGGYLCD